MGIQIPLWTTIPTMGLFPVISGIVSSGMVERSAYKSKWYRSLDKSPWQPPHNVFGIAWSIAYLLMGSYPVLLFSDGVVDENIQTSLNYAFYMQLSVITFWPTVFFNHKRIQISFIMLVYSFLINLGIAIVSILQGYSCLQTYIAGFVMIPYVAWLAFAMMLSFYVERNNDESRLVTVYSKSLYDYMEKGFKKKKKNKTGKNKPIGGGREEVKETDKRPGKAIEHNQNSVSSKKTCKEEEEEEEDGSDESTHDEDD